MGGCERWSEREVDRWRVGAGEVATVVERYRYIGEKHV